MSDNTNELIKEIEKDPFYDDTCSKRKEFVANVSNILVKSEGDATYILESNFSSGETILNHRIKSYINHNYEEQVKCIYINAWESDFMDNPIIPLVNSIAQEFKNVKIKDIENSIAAIINASVDIAAPKIWNNLKIAAYIKNLPFPAIMGATANCNFKTRRNYEKRKRSRNQIFTKYSSILTAKKIFATSLLNLTNMQKIVVLIDELDRCKPDYAIKILETVKHFFGVKNITFLLSINKTQLINAVKCIYGLEALKKNSEDSCLDEYLRKFVDFSFVLPKTDNEQFAKYLYEKSHIKNLIATKQLKCRTFAGEMTNTPYIVQPYSSDYVIQQVFEELSLKYKLDTNKQWQIFQAIEILGNSFEENEYFIPELHIPLLFMYECDSKSWESDMHNIIKEETMYSNRLKQQAWLGGQDLSATFFDPYEMLAILHNHLNTLNCEINNLKTTKYVSDFIKINNNLYRESKEPRLDKMQDDIKNAFKKVKFLKSITEPNNIVNKH